MQLYLTPGACSLADHIALHEAGLAFEPVRVDLATKRTERDEDFLAVNPKGYVPVLPFDDGQVLTENVAILSWIAEQAPQLVPDGPLGRIRMLETLAYITSELHKPLVRMMFPTADADKAAARDLAERRLGFLAERMASGFMLGDRLSAADPYLYVMLRWARMLELAAPEPLAAFARRMEERPAVQRALRDEGLV